ncbi:MAG: hypothetical protein JWN62_1603 [Acidimicrobiales bacterium]|nr:hypothetical protein [Acidimicrobiales bacterium]
MTAKAAATIQPDDIEHGAPTPVRITALAQLLATGVTQAQAAAAFGVSDRTIRRWVSDAHVAAAIRECEEEHLSRLTAGVVDLGHRALEVVRELLDAEDPRLRLRAAAVSLHASGVRGDAAIAIRLRSELRELSARPTDAWSGIERKISVAPDVTVLALDDED